MNILEKIKRVLNEGKYARMASTDEQETSINKIESILKSLGISINGGTTIGKSPQTVILDIKYQGSEIYVNSDGEVEITDTLMTSLNKKNVEEILRKKNLLPEQK